MVSIPFPAHKGRSKGDELKVLKKAGFHRIIAAPTEKQAAKGRDATVLTIDEDGPTLLRTTPKGRQLLKEAAPAWQRAHERITALLGERTTVALRKAVSRFRNAESE